TDQVAQNYIATAKSFKSSFNGIGGAANWVKRPGAAWKSSRTTIYTLGVKRKASSISYDSVEFKNFTYEVRMKHTINPTTFYSGLIVRGTPTFGKDNNWQNGYEFLVYPPNLFTVQKRYYGNWITLRKWTSTDTIKLDWNTLKVVVNGSNLQFFINNNPVWKGRDETFTRGQVGIIMFRGVGVTQIDVDWAKLSVLKGYNPDGQVEQGQTEYTDRPINLSPLP
ncbi:MAG: DUF1080 domain-containing protein, partial [Chloroflexi bacterium]